MRQLDSTYVQNVGALVLDLAQRGLIVRIGYEESVIAGSVLYLQISNPKAGKTQVLKEALNEGSVIAISDTKLVADALVEKLRKS